MHKFSRGNEPDFLRRIRRSGKSWESFASCQQEKHALLGTELFRLQDGYCAYCETLLKSKADGHIEHLERRSDNPERTYDWNNLFFSCRYSDSCGKYKDNNNICFSVADIVDPSREDPFDFFAYNALGGICPKPGISEHERRRAEETIRVFNLNGSPRLTQIRANAAKTVQAIHEQRYPIDKFLEELGMCDCISVYYSLCGKRKTT